MWQRSGTYVMTMKNGMEKLIRGGHDPTATDCFNSRYCQGLYWEGGPPTHVSDLIDNSTSILYRKLIAQRLIKDLAEADR